MAAEDPSVSGVSGRYATALFELARDEKSIDAVRADLDRFEAMLADSAEGVGYLLKDRVSDVDEFAAAVRRVAEGGSALDPAVVSQLVGRRRRDDPLKELTPREREVLEAMAEGRSNQAIAEKMVITLRAVEKHVTSIFSKLRLPATAEDHRRVLAVLTYLQSSG